MLTTNAFDFRLHQKGGTQHLEAQQIVLVESIAFAVVAILVTRPEVYVRHVAM